MYSSFGKGIRREIDVCASYVIVLAIVVPSGRKTCVCHPVIVDGLLYSHGYQMQFICNHLKKGLLTND